MTASLCSARGACPFLSPLCTCTTELFCSALPKINGGHEPRTNETTIKIPVEDFKVYFKHPRVPLLSQT